MADEATATTLNVREMHLLVAEFKIIVRNPDFEIITSSNIKKSYEEPILHLNVMNKRAILIHKSQVQVGADSPV